MKAVGVVYRALDTKLNRPVAVKFLSDDVADAGARRRFQREAQMASSYIAIEPIPGQQPLEQRSGSDVSFRELTE